MHSSGPSSSLLFRKDLIQLSQGHRVSKCLEDYVWATGWIPWSTSLIVVLVITFFRSFRSDKRKKRMVQLNLVSVLVDPDHPRFVRNEFHPSQERRVAKSLEKYVWETWWIIWSERIVSVLIISTFKSLRRVFLNMPPKNVKIRYGKSPRVNTRNSSLPI